MHQADMKQNDSLGTECIQAPQVTSSFFKEKKHSLKAHPHCFLCCCILSLTMMLVVSLSIKKTNDKKKVEISPLLVCVVFLLSVCPPVTPQPSLPIVTQLGVSHRSPALHRGFSCTAALKCPRIRLKRNCAIL